ncbi:MAG TPA: type II 3-dehydroquinate dehydratase [Myxococcaceae bacterium]|nr:type II 3-dehydroquinate dehydratase [Myxococcaceae bacterium]
MGKRLLVLHGPNLNLLGEREGRQGGRLADLDLALAARAKELGLELKVVQSNHEGVLIDTLHAERSGLAGVVVSPAGLFGSYPLMEALEAVGVPAIEVYVGQLGERESVVAEACAATIDGQGFHSYLEALERFAKGDLTGELSEEDESDESDEPEALVRASEGPRKTLGRKVEAAPATPASPSKTLGRKVKGAEATPAVNVLSRALVRQKIADRLAGRLTPSELASWARTKWTEVQTGAAAESGQRELLEDSLQRLTLSAMPASKLSDSELLDMMTRLER